jgi:hypothetical protein
VKSAYPNRIGLWGTSTNGTNKSPKACGVVSFPASRLGMYLKEALPQFKLPEAEPPRMDSQPLGWEPVRTRAVSFLSAIQYLYVSQFPSLLTLLAMIKFIFIAIYVWQRLSIRYHACFDGFCYRGVKVYQPQVKRSW